MSKRTNISIVHIVQLDVYIAMNYKGDPIYTRNHWKCQDCFTPDTQEHIIRCPSYQHLRMGKDLASDKDLVEYFRKVLSIRDQIDDEKNPRITKTWSKS